MIQKSAAIYSQSLKHLDIGCHGFGDKGKDMIVEAVRTTTISSLDFTSLDLSPAQAEKLFANLQQNGHVTRIVVENNERLEGTGLYRKLNDIVEVDDRPLPIKSSYNTIMPSSLFCVAAIGLLSVTAALYVLKRKR